MWSSFGIAFLFVLSGNPLGVAATFDCFGSGPCDSGLTCCNSKYRSGPDNGICVDFERICRDNSAQCGSYQAMSLLSAYPNEVTCYDSNGQNPSSSVECGVDCGPTGECVYRPQLLSYCGLARPSCTQCANDEVCQYVTDSAGQYVIDGTTAVTRCMPDPCPGAYPGGPKLHCYSSGDVMYSPYYVGPNAPCLQCRPGYCGWVDLELYASDFCVYSNGSDALDSSRPHKVYCGPCLEGSCVVPAPPLNGGLMTPPLSEMVQGRVANGSSVTYSCRAGYKLGNPAKATRTCVNGAYAAGAPACVVDDNVPSSTSTYNVQLFSDRSCSSAPTLSKSSLPKGVCLANDVVQNQYLRRFKFTSSSTTRGRVVFYYDQDCTRETASLDVYNGECRVKNTGLEVINVKVTW